MASDSALKPVALPCGKLDNDARSGGVSVTRPCHCTTLELFLYVTGWAVCIACYSVNEESLFPAIVALYLPGILILGPIGLTIGGRTWFWPFALAGAAASTGWIAYVVIEAMNAVR